MANENRLIDANVVFAKKFTTGLSDASGNYYGYADVVFADDIENAPTVDAVEVVHGRWVDSKNNTVPFDSDGSPVRSCFCSVCGEWLTASDEYACIGKYCPNCGARMDGGMQ